jgi:endonuclease III
LVKIARQLRTMESRIAKAGGTSLVGAAAFPRELLDLIILHKLHLLLGPVEAWESFSALKAEFVDWNEVRVSPISEIQEHLRPASSHPSLTGSVLELSVFIKDLLEFVHQERHSLNLENLADENLTEIRRYLKQIRGMDPATIELVLFLRKDHPAVPLNQAMALTLLRIGILRPGETHDRRAKRLFKHLEPAMVLPFHLYVANLSRETCPPDEKKVACPSCEIKQVCAFFKRRRRLGRQVSSGPRLVGASPAGRKAVRAAKQTSASRRAAPRGRPATEHSPRRVVVKPIAGKRVRKTSKHRSRNGSR